MRTASHRQPPLRLLRMWEWAAALSLPSVSLTLHTPTARQHLTLAVSMLRLGARGAQRMRTASHRQPPLRLLRLWEWTAALSLPSVSIALHTPTARRHLTLAVSMLRLGARGAQRMRTASHRQPPLRLLRLWEWTAALSLPSVSLALHTPTARRHLTLAVSMLRLGARGAQRMRTASHRQPPLRRLASVGVDCSAQPSICFSCAAYAYCTTAPDAGCLDAPTGCEGCTAYAHCLSPPASPPPLASVGVDCSAQPSICFSCAAYAYCTTAPDAGCLDAPTGCEGCTAYAHCLSPPASPPPLASVGVDCSAQPSICFSCAAYAYCTTAPDAGCLDAPTGCEGCTAYAHCLSPPASPPPLAPVGVDCSAQPSICFSCAAYAYCTTAPDAGCLDAPTGCEGCTAYAHCLPPPASPPPLASVGVDCSAQPSICFSCAAYAYCTTAPAAGCLDAPTGCEGCTAYAHCLSPPASPPPSCVCGSGLQRSAFHLFLLRCIRLLHDGTCRWLSRCSDWVRGVHSVCALPLTASLPSASCVCGSGLQRSAFHLFLLRCIRLLHDGA